MSPHWAVIGGGMLGLTLAQRLAQKGCRVTLCEGAETLGGLASAWRLGDVTWDRHYHVTLLSDSRLRNLLREIGLEQEMKWVTTKTGFYSGGKLYSMSNTKEFLTFPPLSLVEKLRLGGTIFACSKIKNWRALEQISVADWLTKWSGKSVFRKIWEPLLLSKLGEAYKRVSAAFIWAHTARMYAARRSGHKTEMFGYVPGGYARILDRLGQTLGEKGVDVRLKSIVSRATAVDGGVKLDFDGAPSETFDRVVFTTPASIVARACPDLNADERTRFQGIEYLGIVCCSLLLKKPLAGYYVTNITDPSPLTAVIEMTTIVDPAELGGRHLVYLPKYLPPGDPGFDRSDAEIEEEFLGALEKMYPHFRRDDVLAFRISRVRTVMALPTLNYSDRLPPMRTSIPNLFVVNSAHILKGNLNVNETIAVAEDALEQVLMPADGAIRTNLHEDAHAPARELVAGSR